MRIQNGGERKTDAGNFGVGGGRVIMRLIFVMSFLASFNDAIC